MIHILKPLIYKKFKTTFSKSGEDAQLWQLLKKGNGFYIDVGGHHPVFANNSYFFYIRGWNGIVVEPNPKFKALYQKFRSKDIVVSVGIADFDGELEYFEMNGDARNTFSKNHLNDFGLEGLVNNQQKVPVKKLSSICTEFLSDSCEIDFLSVDVEGMELEVMKSNDWVKFRPKYILAESHESLNREMNSDITNFLESQDYELVGKSLQGFYVGTLCFRAKEVVFPQQ